MCSAILVSASNHVLDKSKPDQLWYRHGHTRQETASKFAGRKTNRKRGPWNVTGYR